MNGVARNAEAAPRRSNGRGRLLARQQRPLGAKNTLSSPASLIEPSESLQMKPTHCAFVLDEATKTLSWILCKRVMLLFMNGFKLCGLSYQLGELAD
jgi:hypothetical protein